MARRPTADKNVSDLPMTLQKAFDACRASAGDSGAEDEPAEAQVGERLRELRQQKDLSVRALAARSGLAINTLSMIENGRTSPSVSTLQILARALEVPIAAFFEQPAIEKRVVHVRRQQRPAVTIDTTRLEHLGRDLAGNAVQPFVVTLQPGAGSGQSLIVHTGHEFVYCLSGQVEYSIEEETYLLAAGDSLVFESHLPHCWKNTTSEPAQVILILIPADVRDAPAERHFPLEYHATGE
jgi:transcriptional regulator with XRE-family HTH domain